MTYSSAQVCAFVGATYRMLDYWDRQGRLGPARRPGTGYERRYQPFEAVLARACVLIAEAVPAASWKPVPELHRELRDVYRHDPSLSGWRLVIEHAHGFIARSTAAPCALVVNLATCAADLETARARLGDIPLPLFEEVADPADLPTVAEWLEAGAPMREVTPPQHHYGARPMP
jgi:hypothetical protein